MLILKKLISLSLFIAAINLASVTAQDPEPYYFKPYKQLPATPVKNQQQTGTCWAFSAVSFLESEVERINGFQVNLSEMFVVRNIYHQKCENFVRRQGTAQFGEGGLAHDAINAVRQYGIVPEDIYPGRKEPTRQLNHSALEKKLKDMCAEYADLGKKGTLPADWLTKIDAALDEEFGVVPRKFSVEGKPFTAGVYRDYLGINPDNYVTITSFTHHPFYQPFILEVPDNFSNGQMLNLPLDEMMRSLNYSVQQGYSVEWDADVSNDGFSAKYALALVPDKNWADKNEAQRTSTFKYLEPQKKITQEYRQDQFDRQITMDDHLMHITGIETETSTTGIYYTVKNSWGEISDLKGYLRISEAYMRLNTISFMVNKNALPIDIAQRFGLAPGEATIPETPKTKSKTQTMEAAPNSSVKLRKMAPAAKKASPAEDH